jgi:hypothetical protein
MDYCVHTTAARFIGEVNYGNSVNGIHIFTSVRSVIDVHYRSTFRQVHIEAI